MTAENTTRQPRMQECWRCDFASGYRGMDRCHVCDGSGMIYTFASDRPGDNGARVFPGTPEGKAAARRAMADAGR